MCSLNGSDQTLAASIYNYVALYTGVWPGYKGLGVVAKTPRPFVAG